jgi:multiple sugar transport system ATP-binding protein
MMANIELENVSKRFGDNLVVDDVNISVSDGEFLALVGPSGCGKSTLLRMISGLETIDEGSISIDGKAINGIPPKDRNIAMVFQNYALYPHMTIYDNLAFGLKMKGVDKKDIDALVHKTADLLDISELLERRPKQLSGGQKQRIAVGRAIVRNPKAFLFDEPLSNLDAKLRVKMRTDLLKLHKTQKATSIYVTHDQIEAMTMADRIAVINKGVIQQIDTPINVYSNPKNLFVASFIGSPSMNFIPGTIKTKERKSKFVSSSGLTSCEIPTHLLDNIDPKYFPHITLGIRPEDITIQTKQKSAIPLKTLSIDLIEQMGDVSLMHFSVEPNLEWTVKSPPIKSHKIGEQVELQIMVDKLHFFDSESQINLTDNRAH